MLLWHHVWFSIIGVLWCSVVVLLNSDLIQAPDTVAAAAGDKVRAIRHVAVSFEQKELEKQQLLAGASSVT